MSRMHACAWTALVDREIEHAYDECVTVDDYAALHRTRAVTTALMSIHYTLHDLVDSLAAQTDPERYVGGTGGS